MNERKKESKQRIKKEKKVLKIYYLQEQWKGRVGKAW